MRNRIRLFCPLLGLCLLLAKPVWAEDDRLEKNSPFLPLDSGKKVEPVVAPVPRQTGLVSREIEFRGIVKMKGVYQFSLFNKKEQKGHWIKENSTSEGLTVKRFDEEKMSVLVQYNGQTENLKLATSDDIPTPVTTASNPSTPNNQPQINQPQTNRQRVGQSEQKPRRVIPRRRVILPQK